MINPRNLVEVLNYWALHTPNKICLKTPDNQQLSYGELYKQSEIVAKALLQKDCIPGNRIVIGINNSIHFFASLFGCFRAGCVAIPIDEQLTEKEISSIVTHATPKAVITNKAAEKNSIFSKLSLKTIFLQEILEKKTHHYPVDLLNTIDLNSTSLNITAILLYTSGTTGKPKAVMHSHKALINKATAISRWFSLSADDVALCMLPTHFGHGLICNCLPNFIAGGSLVIAKPFNLDFIKILWRTVQQHNVTWFSSVPTIIRLICQRSEFDNPYQTATSTSSMSTNKMSINKQLKFVTCASSPLLPAEIKNFEDAFKTPLLNCYGLTETAGWSTCSRASTNRDLTSVGQPLEGIEIRIINEQYKTQPKNTRGEVQIRGKSIMQGYYNDPILSAQILQENWFTTGDIGEQTSSGDIILHARKKELIIRAGKNIYPAEVDAALMSHPEVAEAYTIGLDDPMLGEKVAACIVRKNTSSLKSNDLLSFLQDHIAGYKCPQEIIFTDNVPKNSRGKVNRLALRKNIMETQI